MNDIPVMNPGPLTEPTLDGEIDLLKEDRSSGKIEANLEVN